jgi:ABC-type Na+ efflux pump permease subunit
VSATTYYSVPLLFLLLIPVVMPSTPAAYSVAGEREQGTLEPLLTTPIRKQEFIMGKAATVMIPTLALSYAVSGLFLAAVWLFAKPALRQVSSTRARYSSPSSSSPPCWPAGPSSSEWPCLSA